MSALRSLQASAATIWVDVEDLFDYARSNPRPSGIQRVAFQILRNLELHLAGTGRLRFVRHEQSGSHPGLREIPWVEVEQVFARLSETTPNDLPGQDRDSRHEPRFADSRLKRLRRRLGRAAYRLPPPLRDPLLSAWLHQKEAAQELTALRRAAGDLPRPKAPVLHRNGSSHPAYQGATFLVLGAPWVHEDYGELLRVLRQGHEMRVALLLYDLIPDVHPEWCTRTLIERFRSWLGETLPQCDVLLAISCATAREVENWAIHHRIGLPAPVVPIPMGTTVETPVQAPGQPMPGLPRPGSYVLFVSTLEARKNHALAVRVWRALLDEEKRKQRPTGSVPDLVFAGRVGWLVSDLLQELENASWFDGRVRLIRDPSDVELRSLYEGCLFSIFPSWYEGWGLPVSEALALGSPVLCSSAGALPEAGGTLARYFDPGDMAACQQAVASLLDDPAELARWRAEVSTRFHPTPWSATARAVLEVLSGTAAEALAEPAE